MRRQGDLPLFCSAGSIQHGCFHLPPTLPCVPLPSPPQMSPVRALQALRGGLALMAPPPAALAATGGDAALAAWAGQQQAMQGILGRLEAQFRWAAVEDCHVRALWRQMQATCRDLPACIICLPANCLLNCVALCRLPPPPPINHSQGAAPADGSGGRRALPAGAAGECLIGCSLMAVLLLLLVSCLQALGLVLFVCAAPWPHCGLTPSPTLPPYSTVPT